MVRIGGRGGMLIQLTRALKWRAAGLLVVLYALCVLAPAAAFAFGDSARAAHCLIDDHHGLAKVALQHDHVSKVHAHPDAGSHDHADAQHDDANSSNCCGLVCLSALPAASTDLISDRVSRKTLTSLLQEGVTGLGADLLYRPPISLSSLDAGVAAAVQLRA